MKKLMFGLAMLVAASASASAQTTNPYLNDLLGRATGEIQGAQRDIAGIQAKGQALRVSCWQGDHRSCVALRQMLRNPNLDEMGSLVSRPAGAYWPFDPYGNMQPSGRW
ncbi:MAG: hypothetical protein AB7O80_01445 [Acetobacteraceae bacterium]